MLQTYTHNMALTCTTRTDSCKSCAQAPALASSHFAQLLCLPTHRALSHGTSSAPWVASSEQRRSEPSLQVKATINARGCKDQCTYRPCHGPPAKINSPLWFVPWQANEATSIALSAWLTSSACIAAAQPWDIMFGEADTSQISLNFSLRRESMEHSALVRRRSHGADNP